MQLRNLPNLLKADRVTLMDIARDIAPHAPICLFCREPLATPDHRVSDCRRAYRR